MNLINNNPYRILALPITASEREIAKQINTLATYAEMGKSKTFDTDFPFLTSVSRTPNEIEEAKKQIEQSEGKLLYSLFWFWKNNTADELALDILKEGNIEKAISIWEKSALVNRHKVYKPIVLNENLIVSSSQFDDIEDEDHLLKKNGGEYIVERKNEDRYSIPTAFYDFNFEDNWSIECDTKWLDGVDNVSYGIAFGRTKGSYYFFGIAGSGSFMFGKYDDWAYIPYIEWKENNNFNKWDSNTLKIEKLNRTLKFYINNEIVATWEAEPFFGNNFGFKVTKNQKISFRNFKFCKLIEDETYGAGINTTSKNFSNIKNLSTLYLSLAASNGVFILSYFRKAIHLAEHFFLDEKINEYSKLVAGERYIYNSEKILHLYITDIIESLKNHLDKPGGITTNQLIGAFSSFPVEAKQFLNNRFVAKQIQNINKEIEDAEKERRNAPVFADRTGKKLVTDTKSDITFLNSVLGEAEFQYQIIADKLALSIMQCGIDAFNVRKTENGEINYVQAIEVEEGYLNEYEYALTVAVTPRAKQKVKENLDSCKEWIANKHLYNCWFCGINPPDESTLFKKTIYQVTGRQYKRVQFKYLPIEIPRCLNCKANHLRIYNKAVLNFLLCVISCCILGLVAGLILGFSPKEEPGFWLTGVLIGGVVGYFVAENKTAKQLTLLKIKGTRESSISKYPVLRQLIMEGWQFSKPTA